MPSSVIRRFCYQPDRRELHVEFVTDRLYVYFEVPEHEVRDFAAAASKGRYFNAHIRDHYPFHELVRDDLNRLEREAMKMENILRAPKAATVKATPAKGGGQPCGRSGDRGV